MGNDIRQLWGRVLEGDHKAWQQLVIQYASLVYTVARRTGLAQADAEDCAQQAWLALYRRRRSIKDPTAIPAWLLRTARREAVRMARNLNRSVVSHNLCERPDGSSLPDAQTESVEFETALAKALEQLDPRCRRLIEELYLSGKSKKYSELASLLGIKPNSLGPLRARCLTKLGDIIKKMGYSLD